MKVGLILNPETPVETMKYYIHKADKITVMTVDPVSPANPLFLKCWRSAN